MICPNCNHDHQNVTFKPDRFPDHDLRTAQCSQCGIQMEWITRVRGIYVFNPVTEEREFVSIERFIAEDFPAVLRGRKKHPALIAFEREHGDG